MTNTAPVYARFDIGHKENAEGISKAEFDAELQKGVDSIKNGRTHSLHDVDNMLAKEFGI